MLKKILAYKIQLIIGALLVVGVAGGIGVGYSISQNTKDSVSDIPPNNSEAITVNETNEVEENNAIEEEPVVAPVQEEPKTTTKPKTSKNNTTTTKNTTTNTSVKNEEKNTTVEQPKQEEPKTTTKTVIIDLESMLPDTPFKSGKLRIILDEKVIKEEIISKPSKEYKIQVTGEGEKRIAIYFEGGLKGRTIIDFNSKDEIVRMK